MPDNCLGDEPSVWEVTEGPAEGLLTGEGERVKAAEMRGEREGCRRGNPVRFPELCRDTLISLPGLPGPDAERVDEEGKRRVLPPEKLPYRLNGFAAYCT